MDRVALTWSIYWHLHGWVFLDRATSQLVVCSSVRRLARTLHQAGDV